MNIQNDKNNPLNFIKDQFGLAQWKLLNQVSGSVDDCEDPEKAMLSLEEVKIRNLDEQSKSGHLPLSAYRPLYEEFLQKLSGDKYQPGTIENRKRHLDSVEAYWPAYSRVPACELEPAHMQNMRPTMRQMMYAANGKQPSKNTLNVYGRVVSYLLGFLVGLGVMDMMRALVLMRCIGYAKPSKRKTPNCTVDQEETMRRYLEGKWWHTSYKRAQIVIAFEIFVTYGIREEMFQELLIEHVNLPNRLITFHLNKLSCDEVMTRTFRIPESLAVKLAEFIERHGRLPGQRLVEANGIDRSLKTAARKAGIPNWHAHASRHYVGNKLMLDGVPIPAIAWLMGHKDGGITLLKYYLQEDLSDAVNDALERQDLRREVDVDSQFWFARQLPMLIGFLKRLETVPKHAAKAIIKHLHTLDRYVRSKDFAKAMALAGAAQDPKNPLNCTPKTIYIPKSHSPQEKNIIAANVLTLITRGGMNVNSLTVFLRAGRDSIYAILRADTMNEQVLQKIADYFKIPRKQLADPAMPEIDWDLVFDNVQLLTDRYGTVNIPRSTEISRFLNGHALPNGTALRALADYAGVGLDTLLDINLAAHLELIKRPLPLAENDDGQEAARREVEKQNLVKNLKVLLLIKGVNITEVSRTTGIRLNQAHDYFSGRHFPPPEKLKILAKYFGKTPNEVLGEPIDINTAEVGRMISGLLGKYGDPAWKLAPRIHIAYPKLEQIIKGEELPNGPQLHLIAKFLEVSPERLLGIPVQPKPEIGTGDNKLAA